jgi:hypothetical protein
MLELTIRRREGCGAQHLHCWAKFNTAPSLGGASAEGGTGGHDHRLHTIWRNHHPSNEEGGLVPGTFVDSAVEPSCPTCFFHDVGGNVTTMVVEACSWQSIICWLAAKHTIADGWVKDGVPLPSWRVSWDGVVGLLWCADQPDG